MAIVMKTIETVVATDSGVLAIKWAPGGPVTFQISEKGNQRDPGVTAAITLTAVDFREFETVLTEVRHSLGAKP